ncbi:unnamed protein product [Prorocentrum cordatum]|uniref:CRAL-TRIO domain-containing protein n=1 Tax=Prorocentrum cordatum TaxID=2364126 RepID=A0ABN9UFE8_9DINO|nr:unnamed protein product [Polarella glacialis]
MGRCDWDGLARAGLIERLQGAFAAHLEDLLQAGRAASRRQGRLVRARVIVDCSGLGRDALRHRAESKKFLSLGKRYFPEVTASITVVRAPRVFTLCFGFVRPMLTEAMRRKICIFGEDFEEGLRAHSGLPLAALPAFLGGKADDGEVCSAEPVPP